MGMQMSSSQSDLRLEMKSRFCHHLLAQFRRSAPMYRCVEGPSVMSGPAIRYSCTDDSNRNKFARVLFE